jgi:hypothetical protein
VVALVATLNEVAAEPPELLENVHVPVELTVNASAKLDDALVIVRVTADDDHVLINKQPPIGPPVRSGWFVCTTKVEDVVTVTPVSCAPTAVNVFPPSLAPVHSV